MAVRRLSDRSHETDWARVGALVAKRLGLHFPPERVADLKRGVAAAAADSGCTDLAAYTERLLAAPLTRPQLELLATHLTIGETYFFRDKAMFDVLAQQILPPLIESRRGREQRLRLWSAACCSGEEAYSLAILLYQLVPDLADWHVTILATDINPLFLTKAVAGAYGEWSFRDTSPDFKDRYFDKTGQGRYVIRPELKKLVRFEHLNLVDDVYPSLATDTNAMDVILCRNVLMYFTPGQIRKVIGKLHHALLDGGWLAVAPSETSQDLFARFVARHVARVTLYRKDDAGPRASQAEARAVADRDEVEFETPASTFDLYAWGYEPSARTLPAAADDKSPGPDTCSLRARELANQGQLAGARQWCDRWIAADKLNAAAHYLRAIVLVELGQEYDARGSLRHALYLDPDFVLAHFALGTLARARGDEREADRHLGNALGLLQRLPPDGVVPEGDGLTVARLTETITVLTDGRMPPGAARPDQSRQVDQPR